VNERKCILRISAEISFYYSPFLGEMSESRKLSGRGVFFAQSVLDGSYFLLRSKVSNPEGLMSTMNLISE